MNNDRIFRHPKTPSSFFVMREDKNGTLVGWRYWFMVERKKFTASFLYSKKRLEKAGWIEFEDTEQLHIELETLCLEKKAVQR